MFEIETIEDDELRFFELPDQKAILHHHQKSNVLVTKEEKKKQEQQLFEEDEDGNRTYKSPIILYHELGQGKLAPQWTMFKMLTYFSMIQTFVNKHYAMRKERDYELHRCWFLIKDDPQQALELYAKYEQETASKAKKTPVQTATPPPFAIEKCSWNRSEIVLQRKNELDEWQRCLIDDAPKLTHYNTFSLMRLESLEDSLIIDSSATKIQKYLCQIFQESGSFVKVMVISGKVGVGKKTLLQFIFNDFPVSVDVQFTQFTSAKEVGNFILGLDTNRIDVCLESQPSGVIRHKVFVIYNCDFADASTRQAMQGIFEATKTMQRNLKTNQKNQRFTLTKYRILLIFLTNNVMDRPFRDMTAAKNKNNIQHFPVFAKESKHFTTFYHKIRQRILSLYGTKLPSSTAECASLRQVCERRDVRALLMHISFLWASAGEEKKSLAEPPAQLRMYDNQTPLNIFDIVNDIVLKHRFPFNMKHMANLLSVNNSQETNMKKLLGYATLQDTKPRNHYFRFASAREVSVLPRMILHNLWPYVLNFKQPKSFLELILSHDDDKGSFRAKKHELHLLASEKAILRSYTQKISNYLCYKQLGVKYAEHFLLRDLVVEPMLTLRQPPPPPPTKVQRPSFLSSSFCTLAAGQPKKKQPSMFADYFARGTEFKLDYCQMKKNIASELDKNRQQATTWRDHQPLATRTYLFQFSTSQLIQHFGSSIREFFATRKTIVPLSDISEGKQKIKKQPRTTAAASVIVEEKVTSPVTPAKTEPPPPNKKKRQRKESKKKETKKRPKCSVEKPPKDKSTGAPKKRKPRKKKGEVQDVSKQKKSKKNCRLLENFFPPIK